MEATAAAPQAAPQPDVAQGASGGRGVEDNTLADAEVSAIASTKSSIFEDRRDERKRTGLVRWEVEQGVPDVGGLGWRSRAGHLLKNQTYYAVQPNLNLWDNPTHAGPKTWKSWHGPKLRRDADLMERLDRRDVEQLEWETKKAFVNTVRVQTLDRLAHQKVENGQRELASQWAPHRRARREVHRSFDIFTSDLDSMPMKELKKVLTECVLKHDREAIRAITKRIQAEETWKASWKNMERERRLDIRSDHEQRMAYNDMLEELAGQPPRRKDPNHRLPNDCTKRIEEMARPADPKPPKHVTQRTDYRGLYHVDNKHALEARFPGGGHDLSVELAERATANAQPGWPPPPRFETPHVADPEGTEFPQMPSTASTGGSSGLRQGSVPVSQERLDKVALRSDDEVQAQFATLQRQSSAAPPAPEQKKTLLVEPLVNDALHMGLDFAPRETHTSRLGGSQESSKSIVDTAPPRRDLVYPVVVPTVEEQMVRPEWRPKRPVRPAGVAARPTASADPRRRRQAKGTDNGTGALSAREPRSQGTGEAEPALAASTQLSMPRAEPTLGAVCQHLDEFEATLRPAPHIGNFWMGAARSAQKA